MDSQIMTMTLSQTEWCLLSLKLSNFEFYFHFFFKLNIFLREGKMEEKYTFFTKFIGWKQKLKHKFLTDCSIVTQTFFSHELNTYAITTAIKCDFFSFIILVHAKSYSFQKCFCTTVKHISWKIMKLSKVLYIFCKCTVTKNIFWVQKY